MKETRQQRINELAWELVDIILDGTDIENLEVALKQATMNHKIKTLTGDNPQRG